MQRGRERERAEMVACLMVETVVSWLAGWLAYFGLGRCRQRRILIFPSIVLS